MPLSAAPTAPRVEHRTDPGTVLGLGTPTPRLSWTVPRADADWRQTAYEVEVTGATGTRSSVVDSADSRCSSRGRRRPWRPASGPGAGARRARRRLERLEPDDDRRGRAARPGGLDRPLRLPGRIGGLRRRPRPCSPGRSRCPGRSRAPGSTPPRTGSTWRALNGRRIDDTRARARLDGLRAPAPLPRLRRHGPGAPGANVLERPARQRLVPRPPRLPRRRAPVRRPARPARPARGDDRRRHGARPGDRRLLGRARERGRSTTTSTTARRPTCAARGDLAAAGRRGGRPRRRTSAVLVAPDGPPIRPTERPARAAGLDVSRRAARSSTSGRTPSAGCACGRTVCPRARRSSSGTRRCSSDGSSAPGRCGRRRPPTPTSSPGGDEVLEPSLTLHGFRYAEVSGVPDLRAEDLELVVVGSDLERTGWFTSLRRPARPPARERRVEHARQLRRRAHGLPAARRATGLDRRHPGLRADGDLPVRHRRIAHLLAGRPGGRAVPRRLGPARGAERDPHRGPRPRGGRLGRRRDGRAVDAPPAHRRPRRPRAPAAEHARVGRQACGPRRSRPALDGWLPVRRLAGPRRPAGRPGATPRPTATWSRPRTSPARPRSWPTRPRCSDGDDLADDVRRARRGGPRRVRPDVRHPGRARALRRADRLRAGPGVGPPPDGGAARARRDAGWPTSSVGAASGSARASSGRRSSATHSPAPATSRSPTGCCCRPRARRGSTR